MPRIWQNYNNYCAVIAWAWHFSLIFTFLLFYRKSNSALTWWLEEKLKLLTCSEAGIFAPFHLLMQAMTVMSEGRRLRHSLWFTLVDPGMFVFVLLEEWYTCRLLYWNSFFSIQYFSNIRIPYSYYLKTLITPVKRNWDIIRKRLGGIGEENQTEIWLLVTPR